MNMKAKKAAKKTYCLFKDKYLSPLFMRFVLGGLFGYAFRMAFTWAFTEWLVMYYFIFYFIAETTTTIVNFIISMKYIFRLKDNAYKRFVRFVIWTMAFYFVNLALVNLLTDVFKVHYLLSITLVIGILMLIKFPLFDQFIFHKRF